MSVIICRPGCCGGCNNCYGMGIGCHAKPCRCDKPCICDIREESRSPDCERHR